MSGVLLEHRDNSRVNIVVPNAKPGVQDSAYFDEADNGDGDLKLESENAKNGVELIRAYTQGSSQERKSCSPAFENQRCEAPASIDTMTYEFKASSVDATTKSAVESKKGKGWLKRTRSKKGLSEGFGISEQNGNQSKKSNGRRRSLSFRRKSKSNIRKAEKVSEQVNSSEASEPLIKLSVTESADFKSQETTIFGMDVSKPDQLEALHKYFLHLGEENLKLEKSEEQLAHENNEIICENEELKQQFATLEEQLQQACDTINQLQAKNTLLEQQVEGLREELDSPTFL